MFLKPLVYLSKQPEKFVCLVTLIRNPDVLIKKVIFYFALKNDQELLNRPKIEDRGKKRSFIYMYEKM